MNIPLVFYGENEAEYGNPIADNNSSLGQSQFSHQKIWIRFTWQELV